MDERRVLSLKTAIRMALDGSSLSVRGAEGEEEEEDEIESAGDGDIDASDSDDDDDGDEEDDDEDEDSDDDNLDAAAMRREIRKLRRENAKRRIQAKEAEEEKRKREEADLSEKERAEKRAAEAEERVQRLEARIQRQAVAGAVEKEARKLGFIDPEDALLNIQAALDELDDDDRDENGVPARKLIRRRLRTLAESKPHLVSTDSINGGSSGPNQKKKVYDQRREELIKAGYIPTQ